MRIRHLAVSIAAALLAGATFPALAEIAANADRDSPFQNSANDTSRDQRGSNSN